MSDQPWVAPGSEPQRRPSDPGVPPPPYPPAGSAPSAHPPPAYPPPHLPAPGGQLPPGAGPYRSMEFRPGIVPLRPLGLGDVYGGVLKAVRGNPAATIGLATLTSLVLLVPTTALGAWLAGRGGVDPFGSALESSDTVPDGFVLSLVGQYLPSLGQLLAGILLAGFLAQVVGQAVLGRKVGIGEIWRATRGRVLAMVGVVLVTGLAVLLLVLAAVLLGVVLVLLIDPGSSGGAGIVATVLVVLLIGLVTVALLVLLATKWALATPAVVLERLGVFAALGRSWGLVGSPWRGPFWRLPGIRLLTGLIVGIASWIITLPITLVLVGVAFAATSEADTGTFLVLQTVVSGIAGLVTAALTTPFSAGVDALLYVDVRMRTEGLDVRLIQTAQGAAAPPWPYTAP